MRHTCVRVFMAIALAGLLVSPATASAQAHSSNGAQARLSKGKFRGLSYGEWLAATWQAALFTPIKGHRHPWINGGALMVGDRVVAPSAPVVPLGTPRIRIPITIEPGTPLSLGIIGVSCSVAEAWPFHGEDEAELRACANGLLDSAQDLSAVIDGRRVANVEAYRTTSPMFRYGPLPANNFLGLPAGTLSDSVTAGYGMLVAPLSVGVHRIAVSASVPDFGIGVDTEFVITVVPRKK